MAIEPSAFFALVDRTLTPAMAGLGYLPVFESVNDEPGSSTGLTSDGLQESAGFFMVYEVGYEASSDEVQRLVSPNDPETASLLLLEYDASNDRIDRSGWRFLPAGDPLWDVRTDGGLALELVVTRLAVAVREFAASLRP